MRLRACIGVLSLLIAAGAACAQERDEFGLRPDVPHDDQLMLPDPVLDRSWPMPEPGEGTAPPAVAPDEDEIDPFSEQERPAPPPPDEEEELDEGYDGRYVAPLPAPTPVPEPDPFADALVEPEVDEPAGLADEDEPSPLDLDEQRYREEASDDGDW